MSCQVSYTTTTGTIVQIEEQIPGVGLSTVYDATGVCPAFQSIPRTNFTWGIPNNHIIFNGNPSKDDILQTNLGLCILAAWLASLTDKKPTFVRSSIVEVGNIVYVRLYYKSLPFYVKMTKQIPLYSSGRYSGNSAYNNFAVVSGRSIIWPQLYIKAFAIMTNYFPDFLNWDPVAKGYQNMAAMDSPQTLMALCGVSSSSVISPSTMTPQQFDEQKVTNFFGPGRSTVTVGTSSLINTVTQIIKDPDTICIAGLDVKILTDLGAPISSGQPITIGTGGRYFFSGGRTAFENEMFQVVCIYSVNSRGARDRLIHVMVYQHAYSVLGIDSNNNVILRNPWGTYTFSDSTLAQAERRTPQTLTYPSGLITISLNDFVNLFELRYGSAVPPPPVIRQTPPPPPPPPTVSINGFNVRSSGYSLSKGWIWGASSVIQTTQTNTPEECKQNCINNNQCEHWSRDTRNRNCTLRRNNPVDNVHERGIKNTPPGVTNALVQSRDTILEQGGNSYTDPNRCVDICNNDPACLAWYHRNSTHPRNTHKNTCVLFNRDPNLPDIQGFVLR